MSVTLIEIPQWGTWNLIEIIWFASGVIALLFSGIRMRPLWWDVRDAWHANEKDLFILARGYLRRELVRIAQALCVVGIGLYTGFDEPLVPGPAKVTITALVITGALILISLLISVQSALDWRNRQEVKDIVRTSQ